MPHAERIAAPKLNGQVALVTGGGRGLGRGFALGLADAGARVAVTARSAQQLDETVAHISAGGGQALALPADVADQAAVARAVATTQATLGPIDILINNAGVMAPYGPDWEVEPSRWWRTFEVNTLGPFLFAHAVLPSMVARGRGRIVNVSSGAGYSPQPFSSAYGASKAALTQITNSLALAAQPHGITVFAYSPGFVRTAMTEDLAASADVARWSGENVFRRNLEAGVDVPMADSVAGLLFLLSGQADGLTGRQLHASDDLTALAQQAEQIRRDDLYTLRLRK